MRLLADSFSPKELNEKVCLPSLSLEMLYRGAESHCERPAQGYGLYLDFRPDVDGWGKKAELKMSTILDLRRFLTHAPQDAAGPAGEVGGLEEDGAREVKQETEDGEGAVRVKPEPEAEDVHAAEPPTAKRVKREEDEDGKPRSAAGERDEFDALLEADDDLFAAVDL